MSSSEPQVLANYINNEQVAPLGGDYLDGYNPSTGKVFCLVPDSGEEDVDKAVEAAKAAFKEWSAVNKEERSRILLDIASRIEERLDEFAEAESKDQGKPVWLAKQVDIPRAVYNFRFFATAILHTETPCTVLEGKAINYVTRHPVGVAGLISPWNLPLYLGTWKIAPALATGNTVVWKPSELTSLTAHLLAEVLQESELPPGACNIVMGLGAKAGAAMVQHPDVPLISFTGGTATAEHIIRDSAKNFKKLSLELGGKNPNLIFADCDFDKAVATTLRSSFTNQGEICLCGSRIFVQRDIYDDFLAAFVKGAQSWTVGDPKDPETKVGALNSKPHMEKVLSFIEMAKENGGTVECGGERVLLDGELAEGYFVAPTIITGLSNSDPVCQNEIFGPVVTVVPFDTEEEALEMANDVKYGLSATVWTENIRRANRVAASLHTGTVWINTWMMRDLRVPFGGVKASGVGREGGDYSIDFYTEMKTVCMAE